MLSLHVIRANPEQIIAKLLKKNFDGKDLIFQVISLDDNRKSVQNKLDLLLASQNSLAKATGMLMKEGKVYEAEINKRQTALFKEQSREAQVELESVESQIQDILYKIPNLPHDSVPFGKTPEDNEIVETVGEIPTLYPGAKPHWDLCEQYKLIDFELGVKIAGAGFPVYMGKGARLQRALINYFLDQASLKGYEEIEPPILVNEDSGYGTGQLPDKEGQMYHVGIDNLYLIPTAEVPVTNLYRDVLLKEEDFPIKNTAYTPCFRREAGSYGKDVRGLNRLHQFDKVEIVQIQHPDKSYETLEAMREQVAELLRNLGLPFRVLRLCGGDMNFASALTYDFEVYSTAQGRWLEVSSVSNFESFQSNRMKLRYKAKSDGKNYAAHTLNGSALALPRIVASILENFQTEEGIKIPAVLVPYTQFDLIS